METVVDWEAQTLLQGAAATWLCMLVAMRTWVCHAQISWCFRQQSQILIIMFLMLKAWTRFHLFLNSTQTKNIWLGLCYKWSWIWVQFMTMGP